MLVKLTEKRANYTPGVFTSTFIDRRVRFDPLLDAINVQEHRSCPPYDSRWTRVFTSAEDFDPLEVDFIHSSSILEYDNSDYKSFNECHHLVLETTGGQNGNLVLSTDGMEGADFVPMFSGAFAPHTVTDGHFLCGTLINASQEEIDAWWNYLYAEYPSLPMTGIRANIELIIPWNAQQIALSLMETRSLVLVRGEDPVDVLVPRDPYLIDAPSFTLKTVQLIQWSLEDLGPVLDDGYSLPVFLFELVELKGLFKNAVALVTGFPKFLKKLLTKPNIKVSSISDHYLSAIFGWFPLVRDLETIFTRLILLETDLKEFFDNEGKILTHRYRKSLSPYTFRDASWMATQSSYKYVDVPDGLLLGDLAAPKLKVLFNETKNVDNLIFHATTRYSYQIPDMGKLTRMFAIWDRFGINVSASDAWQIFPFSFIVDWLYDVTALLEELGDKPALPVNVVIHDYCYSYKYNYRIRHESFDLETGFKPLPSNTNRPINGHFPYTGTQEFPIRDSTLFDVPPVSAGVETRLSAYHRFTGIPWTLMKLQWPELRLPSGKQLVTAAALLTSKRKYKRD